MPADLSPTASGSSRRGAGHLAWLASVSILALTLAASPARAVQLGNGSPATPADAMAANAGRVVSQQSQQAQQAAQNARESLIRATQALQSLQSVQAAAKAAAAAAQTSRTLPLAIPNGLGAGGLLPNAPAGWTGANAPTQSVSGSTGQTNVTISQTAAQAILNWKSFNVGAQTTLNFDQRGNANWVALNRVDASTGPSQILGNVKADGTVLVVNQSGIIFGGASQINVGSLIASTANITDPQLTSRGIYSAQNGASYTPSFTRAGGKVIVEQGAQISTNAPATVTSGGGTVLLMGTEVVNAGIISTPFGQAQLAAGTDFILRKGYSTDANSISTTRGNEIAVGQWDGSTFLPGGGSVRNAGLIFATQGDITLAGRTITQDGMLLSTTSVNQRGTIHLLNSASDAAGSVVLAGNSVSMIAPELTATDAALNSKRDGLIRNSATQDVLRLQNGGIGAFDNLAILSDRMDQSRIEIVTGGSVTFKTGSLAMAQGGQIAVSAGREATSGRIMAETGAILDVSGVNGVLLPMSVNAVKVNIQPNVLRDSPVNRDSGRLTSQDVWVDARDLVLVPAGTGGYPTDRYYTPGGLLEVSGYLDTTFHRIGEWTAVGGTITLSAQQVAAQKGATFNISGGSVGYQGGFVPVTTVLGSDGRIYTINNAPADVAIRAVNRGFVVDHRRWNVVEIYSNGLGDAKRFVWQDGYTVGRDAGQLILPSSRIAAATARFEGDILADVTEGEWQNKARSASLADGYKAPQTTVAQAGGVKVSGLSYFGMTSAAAVASDVTVSANAADAAGGKIWFDSAVMNRAGLGSLFVGTQKAIAVSNDLTFASGASVSLFGGGPVNIAGDITARGGSVNLGQTADAAQVQNTGGVTVGAGVTIDTRGLWTKAALDPAAASSRFAYINGGSVTIRSTSDVTLDSGSRIDASAGGSISLTGKMSGGGGGDIALLASYTAVGDSLSAGPGNHGNLTLNGTLASYGFTKGGALTLQTGGLVSIGGTLGGVGGTLAAGMSQPYALTLSADTVLPAGTVLPFSVTLKSTNFPAGSAWPKEGNYTRADGQGSTYLSYTQLRSGIRSADGSYAATQADWTVPIVGVTYKDPTGVVRTTEPGSMTIPKGSTITAIDTSWGTNTLYDLYNNQNGALAFPIAVFPDGIYTGQGSNSGYPAAISTAYSAGQTLQAKITLPKGVDIPAGTRFTHDVAVNPVRDSLTFAPAFFQSGFSSYAINGELGLTVMDGTAIRPMMPVYQFTATSFAVPTGSAIADVAQVWTPPLYGEDPLNGKLTQRKGAQLTLASTSNAEISLGAQGGALRLGKGTSIIGDPGSAITLVSAGQITVDGTLRSPGGNISITNNYGPSLDHPVTAAGLAGLSIWIGEGAVLDAAAQAYIATDLRGRPYGVVPAGGSITIGNVGGPMIARDDNGNIFQPGTELATYAHVILRPGSVLDVSGASGVIDAGAGTGSRARTPMVLTSDAGAIALRSYSGIHADGTLRGASGGTGASGGALTVSLETFWVPTDPNGQSTEPLLAVGRLLTLRQTTADSLTPTAAPGKSDANLAFGRAAIGMDQIASGGFDAVTLQSRDMLAFDGDLSLSTGRSLVLRAGSYANNAPTGSVNLAAPYVLLGGQTPVTTVRNTEIKNILPDFAPAGAFKVTGALIDVQDLVAVNFADTALLSTGDLRFLAGKLTNQAGTQLFAPGDITLSGTRIYPVSGAQARVIAGVSAAPTLATSSPSLTGVADATLTITRPNVAATVAPYSLFGALTLTAANIVQGGALYAPLGTITFATQAKDNTSDIPLTVVFQSGSLTSISAAGLIMPYGGTGDDTTWTVNGKTLVTSSLPQLLTGKGISINATSIVSDVGSKVDLSGGGMLTGAGFISGRGGSVDTLLTPLVNSNPANTLSSAGNRVYALVPSASGPAPVAGGYFSAWTGSVPGIGQEITIGDGVPGLPAGTYALLPANYALLPGAFRVELGGVVNPAIVGSPLKLGNGSYLTTAIQGIAHTTIRNSLPTPAIITPADTVRSYAQYKETSFARFELAQAALNSAIRPMLPVDGKNLELTIQARTTVAPSPDVLSWQGTVDQTPAAGGYGGVLSLMASGAGGLYITGDGASSTMHPDVSVVIRASAIDAFNAPTLLVGAKFSPWSAVLNSPQMIGVYGTGSVTVESGAVLTGGQVFLGGEWTGNAITLQAGAAIDTTGYAKVALPDSSLGFIFGGWRGSSFLAVSNGQIVLSDTPASEDYRVPINVGDGVRLAGRGNVSFYSVSGGIFTDTPLISAPTLNLAATTINLGSADAIAAARAAGTLPAGLNLDSGMLAGMIAGGVQRLNLTASGSIDFYGMLDLAGTGGAPLIDTLTFRTAAIYGAGDAGSTARLAVNNFIWNTPAVIKNDASTNYRSVNAGAAPGEITAGGAGTGHGNLIIDARTIVIGHPEYASGFDHSSGIAGVTFDHLLLGFSRVNLNASNRITTTGIATLSAYESGPSPTGYDASTYAGTGGMLNLVTPLVTGEAASVLTVRSGAINVLLPDGATPGRTDLTALGARIDLITPGAVVIDSAVSLPSGRFNVTAGGDITLGANSRLDLAGRTIPMFDINKYSWGGDVALESSHGHIVQVSGGVIDVSAGHNDAGTLALTATDANHGAVLLGGMVNGAGGSGRKGGSIDIRVQKIGLDSANLSGDFSALNAMLDAGGFTERRHFDLKQGSLVLNGTLKARDVLVSVDNGSLTVNGTVDASGAAPGFIDLSASNGVTIGATALLDAHGNGLQVDGYGLPIEAKNRGTISLSAGPNGRLVLAGGARLDVSAPGVVYGQVDLNAWRSSETGNDVNLDVTGPISIAGAKNVLVYGIWRYSATDTAGTVKQDNGTGTDAGSSPVNADGAVGLDQVDVRSRSFMSNALANSRLRDQLARLPGAQLAPGVEIVNGAGGKLTVAGDINLAGYRYGPNAVTDPTQANYGAGIAGKLVLRAANDLTVNGSMSDGFGSKPMMPDVITWIRDLVASDLSTWPPIGDVFSYDEIYRWSLNSGVSVQVSAVAGWTVPNSALYRLRLYRPKDSTGRVWQIGETIPRGTLLTTLWISERDMPLATVLNGISLVDIARGRPAIAATSADAPMLAPGSQSTAIRLVAGADDAAASSRVLSAKSLLGGSGNLILDNSAKVDERGLPIPSVIRTGTGSLGLLAGGDVIEKSPYGIYTAGTDTGLTDPTSGLYLPDHGGDLTLHAQGNVTGSNYVCAVTSQCYGARFDQVSQWLVRSGDAASGAIWAIRFGAVATNPDYGVSYLQGFTGMGTLGGGNVNVSIGGDAGALTSTYDSNLIAQTYGSLQFVVAGGGKVTSISQSGAIVTGGTLVETGGGDLNIRIAGTLDGASNVNSYGTTADGSQSLIANLRGALNLQAGSIGLVQPNYGSTENGDPRGATVASPDVASVVGGSFLLLGDGAATIRSLRDLNIGGIGDPGLSVSAAGQPAFALWRPNTTALSLFAAGGNIAPDTNSSGVQLNPSNNTVILPAQFAAVAASGSIYYGGAYGGGLTYELMPSAVSSLELLATGAIYGAGLYRFGVSPAELTSARFALSGAAAGPNDIPNPFRPYISDGTSNTAGTLMFAYEMDTIGTLARTATNPARIYAVNGDIVNVMFGAVNTGYANPILAQFATQYLAALPARVRAGRDIVNFGEGTTTGAADAIPGLILNVASTDVSIIHAGRSMYFTNIAIGGPGTLEVTAGSNLYQGDKGNLVSLGALVPGDSRPGADIATMAGAGASGPDYAAFAALYLTSGNQAMGDAPLAAQPGKVAKTYQDELIAWLKQRYDYQAASAADALAYFNALAPEQQRVLLRQVYFAELRASGREYNDLSSPRQGSYLRGREAIATLFPGDSYSGDVTLFGGSGIRTLFGGGISMLTPGGTTVIGVEGVNPPGTAGVVTQGSGDIDIYSLGSVLLGQSRVMTTFGGQILAWSAQGDINAGRGKRTTVVYTPPKLVYDDYGHIAIAPVVPSTGAGFATLSPIPQVPPGDIDLVAPLGTIDAGEAGIRVSGNINVAALQILNAANIQVQGKSSGIPTVSAPPVAALATASSTAGATQQTMQPAQAANNGPPAVIIVEIIGYGGGDGTEPSDSEPRRNRSSQNSRSYDSSSVIRLLGNGTFTAEETTLLTPSERDTLSSQVATPNSP